MKYLFGLVACVLAAPALADPLPVDLFARQGSFDTVKLSPDGKHLALTAPSGNQVAVAVIDLETMEFAGVTGFGINRVVADFWWVGNKRLVATPARQLGADDFPRRTGELVGFKHDGSGSRFLIGQTAEDSTGSNIKKPRRENIAGTVINPLPRKPREAIIAIDDLDGIGLPDRGTRVARINTITGSRVGMGHAPVDRPSRLLSNSEGEPVLSITRKFTGTGVLAHARAGKDAEWRALDALQNVGLLDLSTDEKTGYVLATGPDGLRCAYAVPLAGGDHEALLCHPDVDISNVVLASDTGAPIAAVAHVGRPEWVYAPGDHPEAKLLKQFNASFPDNQFVVPVSTSLDGKRVVLLAYSDREPGVYYLFDKAKGKIQQIVAKREWIKPAEMAPVSPFGFKARDGQAINGYLTVPRDTPAKKLPAVVMPHGGPLGVRDRWAWNRDAQFLASRGYAVVQINFRGSGGYGTDFETQGHKQWGGKMIDDLTDGVQALIKQGTLDGKRLCIYGGSYGGYAALMSAVREPDLYQCAVGYVGVYDLKAFRDRTDITDSQTGVGYFKTAIAGSDAEMAQNSPINHLDKLKAPVFIVHGGEDERVPVNQAKLLRAALEDRNHPYEYYVEPSEGHGFYDPEHVAELLTRLERFLGQHIGG